MADLVSKTDLVTTPHEYFSELVKKAMKERRIETYPQVSLYLVNLLEHYLDIRHLYEENEDGKLRRETLAELYLRAISSDVIQQRELLKKLGDTSLYISGFFGSSLQRKLVDIDYYIDMGGIAFDSLSQIVREDTKSRVYHVIAKKFVDFVDVFTHISQSTMIQSNENLLRLYEHYLMTGSDLARDKLVERGLLLGNLSRSKQ